jgi:ribokinase
MKPALAVVGSLNMDFVVSVARLPAPGETALGSDFRMIPGGKGANQACAAGRLGAGSVDVRMIGRVGYDVFADHLRASLSAAGVDTSFVHSSRTQPTGIALIWVDRNGQNSIVVAPGANGALAAADVEAMRRPIRGASHVLFQLETPLDTVAAALALAREEGAVTILDPAPARELSPELLAEVDILTPNESEAAILAGDPRARVTPADAPDVARRLLRLGPRSVVLKLGENGCYYHDGTTGAHYPAFTVEACDTTAAGDTFNAAMAVMLAEGRPMAHALRFACAAAAISVTRPGAQSSIPTRAEADQFLSAR